MDAASSGVSLPCSSMLSRMAPRRSSSSRRYDEALFERAQLDVVQPAGGFLAVAGDEGHGGLVVEQRDRRLDLRHPDVQFFGDTSGNRGHGSHGHKAAIVTAALGGPFALAARVAQSPLARPPLMPMTNSCLRALVLLGLLPLAVVPSSAQVTGTPPPAAASTPGPQFDSASLAAWQWRNIGPFRGGRVVAVTGVPQQPRTFYFGSVGGGVWKTTDGGETWTNITDGQLATSSVGAVAVAPSDPNVIYVGMGEHPIRGVMTSHGDGVYKSTDAGRTWRHVGLDKTRHISRIRIHPTDPETLLVAAQGAAYGPTRDRGVYRSIDGGTTWTQVLFVNETTGASELAMDPTNPRILYAALWDHLREPWQVRSGGPGSGIHKSTDGGTTWQKAMTGLPAVVGKIGLDVSANPDRLYAIVEADPEGGLYRSDDAGKTWTLVNGAWTLHARAWYYMKVAAHPSNPDVVWVLNAAVSKSVDGGRTIATVSTPHGDNHSLWFNPTDPDILIEGNDGGANVSFNGGLTWSTQANQPTAQFYRVNVDDEFPYNVYGGQQDNTSIKIASAAPGGITEHDWYDVGGCESAVPAFDPKDPRFVYAGCYMGIISEFDDRLKTQRDIMAWPQMPAAVPPRDLKYRFNWSAPIVVSRFDPAVIYHGANVLLRSDNRGRTWREMSPDLTRNDVARQGAGGAPITNEGAGGETYGVIDDLVESPHDANTIWVGTDDGLVQLTRDGGKSWANVTPPGVGEAMVNAIEVSPHAPATAYVTFSKYKFNDFTPLVFKTTDFGATWTAIVEGIAPEAWARVVREDAVRPDLLYLGTETGFYVSFTGGQRWTRLQLNLPVTPITDLRVHRNDLVAATAGRAFWILDDLSALQQWTEATPATDVRLFTPRAAYRTQAFGGVRRQQPARGQERPGRRPDRLLAGQGAGRRGVDRDRAGWRGRAPLHHHQAGAGCAGLARRAALGADGQGRVEPAGVGPAPPAGGAGPGSLRVRIAAGPARAAGRLPGAPQRRWPHADGAPHGPDGSAGDDAAR